MTIRGAAAVDTAAVRGSDTARGWRRLTVAAAALVTIVEAVLLQRKLGLFTGGFLASNALATWPDVAAFLGVLFLLNATVTAPACALGLLVARVARLRPRASRFLSVAAGAVPLLAADFLMYEVWAYLGDAFDLDLMYRLTGRHVSELFAVSAPVMMRPVGLGLTAVTAVCVAAWAISNAERGAAAPSELPPLSAFVRTVVKLAAMSSVVGLGIGLSSPAMTYGLFRTPAGRVALKILDRVTDLDGDGYGLLQNPRDPAPFRRAIHPYALDLPGNGIDENGLAGDLPAAYPQFRESPPPRLAWGVKPPVLLFVLESFRADVVGTLYNGEPVTPVLNALSRTGTRVDSAWSHNGFTRQSRFHILTGSLTGRRGTSILDDFKDNGYQVGYFSAQDDSAFGDPGVSYERVDRYYDARQDLDKRYSTYSVAGSLAVPFDVLEQRIDEFLRARNTSRPLFMYVNFHDTHYPYNHDHLKNLVGGDLLPASLIGPARTGDLWRTYLNAAANVDAAIGRVIENVRSRIGASPAVIVIGDHGESLFDGGFLGHGYALNTAQTRVPFVIAGLPMHITTPFGQADLRDAMNDALAGTRSLDERPVIDSSDGHPVFQYLGPLATPGAIGWRTAAGQFTYDFRENRVGLWESTLRPDQLHGAPLQMFDDLVHYWETLQLAEAAHDPNGSF